MSIRIMHTADNHVGLEFKNQPEIRDILKRERLAALERIVVEANHRHCDFLVVAGDLFDHVNISQKLVGEVVSVLEQFSNQVLVMPGNHDYYDGAASKLWDHFTSQIRKGNISLLSQQNIYAYPVHEKEVFFYSCPCQSKHAREHNIGWVKDLKKDDKRLHIGIAHGNVEGLGMDQEGRYFNMTREELASAGMDLWLLGHIHIPYPSPGSSGQENIFMSGTSAPEHIKRSVTGNAWLLEVDDAKKTRFEAFRSGSIRFERVEARLQTESDLQQLVQRLKMSDAASVILDLRMTGRLDDLSMNKLKHWLEGQRSGFLHMYLHMDIIRRIEADDIAREFEDGSFEHRLLSSLASDNKNPLALQMAYDLIKELS